MARRWRPSGSKPNWARCCSSASCWTPRSPPWRPTALWPAGGRGDEPDRLALKWQAVWPGPRVPGLARIAATIYRHLSSSRPKPPRRPGPVGPMPDAALVDAIRAVLTASPFHGEGHRKVWARLGVAGVRTSKRRVLRLMREHDLLAPSRVGAPRGPRNHDGTIIPETVDTMWGTD